VGSGAGRGRADLINRVDWLTPGRLARNEAFLDAVANATITAASTGSHEKLEALRNAVLNAALPSDIDADQQATFLRQIRDFTPTHLRMMKLCSDPREWFEKRNISWEDVKPPNYLVEIGLPELAGHDEFSWWLDHDLKNAQLIADTGRIRTTSEGVRRTRWFRT
jgi:hypothetical protein